MRRPPVRWVGIDVAKATLEIVSLPDATHVQVGNTAAGWTEVITRLTADPPTGIVLEATGSYHVGVTLALAAAGLAPAVINPQRIHAFIRSEGQRGKTDRNAARLLARFGQQKQPAPSPLLDASVRQLKELVGCREDLVKLRTMEQNRLQVATEVTRAHHQAVIVTLQDQQRQVERAIAARIEADAALAARNRLLRSIPGVGPVLSAVLISGLPELGSYSSKAIAALAGLAPYPRDSGAWHGSRFISGGRAPIRRALYLLAFTAVRCNPVVTAHDRKLRVDHPHKVAVIACARRLLGIMTAMLRDGVTWQETKVGQGQFLPRAA